MSYHDYRVSIAIAADDHPFYALIMAAMRKADTDNAARLRAAFPETWDELYARYHAPGGTLPEEMRQFECGHRWPLTVYDCPTCAKAEV